MVVLVMLCEDGFVRRQHIFWHVVAVRVSLLHCGTTASDANGRHVVTQADRLYGTLQGSTPVLQYNGV